MLLSAENLPMDSLSAAARVALRQGLLARIPASAALTLLETAFEIEVDAGQVVHQQLAPGPVNPMVVTAGLFRVYTSSPHGREVTLRYVRSGEIAALPGALAGGTPHGVQAVSDGGLLVLQAARLRHLARTNLEVSWAVIEALEELLFAAADHLAGSVLQSVIERVAGALLQLARDEGGALAVTVNHQQIADCIGSVREVVARSLKQLRAAGLIDRRGADTILLDPVALQRLAAFSCCDRSDRQSPAR
jgi:CRP-like cAMP-binding protein